MDSESIEKALDELGIAQKAGITQKPEMELELFPDEPIHREASDFESGVTTHIYRKYKLERIESESRMEQRYYLAGNLYHERHDK